jgi:hypothetical protein
MGRYLNPSDQGERLHDLLQIVPSRPKRVNSRTPKAIHRRLRRAQVEELVIGYKTGSTVYQLSEQFRINRGTVSKLLERQGVPRRNRSLSPAQIERATELYATGCLWSVSASSSGVTVALCTLPSGRLGYECVTVRAGSARRDLRMRRGCVISSDWPITTWSKRLLGLGVRPGKCSPKASFQQWRLRVRIDA